MPVYEAIGIQQPSDIKPEKNPIWPTALGIALLVYIGMVTGYLYYSW